MARHFSPNSIMIKTILKMIIIAVHFYHLITAQEEMWRWDELKDIQNAGYVILSEYQWFTEDWKSLLAFCCSLSRLLSGKLGLSSYRRQVWNSKVQPPAWSWESVVFIYFQLSSLNCISNTAGKPTSCQILINSPFTTHSLRITLSFKEPRYFYSTRCWWQQHILYWITL